MRTQDARRAAREQKMDLVEVDPRTKPAVCKLLDAGKAQYQAQLKEKVGQISPIQKQNFQSNSAASLDTDKGAAPGAGQGEGRPVISS